MLSWITVDVHRYVIVNDMLLWRPGGEVLPAHAELVCSLLDRIIHRYAYALWLIDAERSVAVGHASRVIYARWFLQEHFRVAAAVFHAPLAARTTGMLTARGVQLRTSGELMHQVCETEAEARSYLDEQRPLLEVASRNQAEGV